MYKLNDVHVFVNFLLYPQQREYDVFKLVFDCIARERYISILGSLWAYIDLTMPHYAQSSVQLNDPC